MSKCEFKILKEAGYEEALYGLSLNKNQSLDKMIDLAEKLAFHDYGHNKLLESIDVWLSVRVPRYVWQDFDTYRLTTKQSESTNHTIMKGDLTKDNFEDCDISDEYLKELNSLIKECNFKRLKRKLPEGFMQTRMWKLNYKNIFNILKQRSNHKIKIIKDFCEFLINNIEHPELLRKDNDE
jgi:hypothetical protein